MSPARRFGATRVRVRVGVLLGVVVALAAGCVPGSPTDAADDGPGTIALLLPESKTSRYESIDRPAGRAHETPTGVTLSLIHI